MWSCDSNLGLPLQFVLLTDAGHSVRGQADNRHSAGVWRKFSGACRALLQVVFCTKRSLVIVVICPVPQKSSGTFIPITQQEPTLRHRQARSQDILMLESRRLTFSSQAACLVLHLYMGTRGSRYYKCRPSLRSRFVKCADKCQSASVPFL